jgi:purine-cytosine permease-like protein
MVYAVVIGEMLSAVSPAGSLTVAVGIIVMAIITWVVTTFGITLFHYYERYTFHPDINAINCS